MLEDEEVRETSVGYGISSGLSYIAGAAVFCTMLVCAAVLVMHYYKPKEDKPAPLKPNTEQVLLDHHDSIWIERFTSP